MSLSVNSVRFASASNYTNNNNSVNSQPAFGSGKEKIGKFINNSASNLVGNSLIGMAAIVTPDVTFGGHKAIIYKLTADSLDLIDYLSYKLKWTTDKIEKKFSAANYPLNIFAHIADGFRAIGKSVSDETTVVAKKD